MFRYVILGLLRRGTPFHGYGLMKAYRERSGIQVSTGNFYRELQRLAGEGLVEAADNPPGADPRRVPYVITPRGTAAFDAWLFATPAGVGHYEDEISSRAVFLSETDAARAPLLLDGWREEVWIRSKMAERARCVALAARREGASKGSMMRALLMARRLKHLAAELDFLEELAAAAAAPTERREPLPAEREPLRAVRRRTRARG